MIQKFHFTLYTRKSFQVNNNNNNSDLITKSQITLKKNKLDGNGKALKPSLIGKQAKRYKRNRLGRKKKDYHLPLLV